jgi:uncharacterized membrane protein
MRRLSSPESANGARSAPAMLSGSAPTPAPMVCPACGGTNAPDAVFCANAACHKALGEFRYVKEELDAETRWFERLADRISGFIGKPHFIAVHVFWLTVWVAINTGLLAIIHRFDDYPFELLGILLSIEAIFITGFLLISQNRQNAHADKRAELDYEVNVRTYREINEIDTMLKTLLERMDRLEQAVREPKRERRNEE